MIGDRDQPAESPSIWLTIAAPGALALSVLALGLGLLAGVALDEGGGEATPPTTTEPSTAAGADVFASAGCGGCHTLSAAGAGGTVGPNLDATRLSVQEIEEIVANGRGTGMPAFADRLDADEIAAVAAYVSESAATPS